MDSIIAEYKALLVTLISNPQQPFDETLRGSLPQDGGVYRIFEKGSGWQSSVYVGKTTRLRGRIYRDHLMGNRRASTLKRKLIASGQFSDEEAVKQYLKDRCLVQYMTISDEALRTSFEHFAVGILKPQFND
ncbi:MAG: GIY-YIG nuclease family protein [Anaerolineae bacterium]|nr:GIY-YIG nuclease family protein [Anaerolineae bacterium]